MNNQFRYAWGRVEVLQAARRWVRGRGLCYSTARADYIDKIIWQLMHPLNRSQIL